MSAGLFLDDAELQRLTRRKYKSKQIAWLRAAGMPFRVSATGHPVVTRAAVEGRSAEPEPRPSVGWTPRVIGAR
ncbi:DUF4224 domain-containing protein [Acidovorax sp. NCPPB 4044]|uniref:DUF4224 domain-containing protein n=1 Tax=Acidovorax sp. NCPPB 4044 TaxID=2940490 RepID=UPI00230445BC|nr:DUF4224 domain-containing protein [Acidovorax sp. NCPPB 4044]MDA8522026.1 DUF4224 domain-containing protein [Acidovorax sp. NCPPB 4044]